MANAPSEAAVGVAEATNWRRVGLFLAVTFVLTWLLDLGIYLSGGAANQAVVMLLQLQMLIPAATAIFLGFFWPGSPQRASVGRARAFFVFFLVYCAVFSGLAGASLVAPGLTMVWLGGSQVLAILGLPVLLGLRFAGGRESFARAGLQLGSARVWLLAGLGVLAFAALQTGLNAVFGLGRPAQVNEIAARLGLPADLLVPVLFVQMILLGPFLGLVVSFGEEYGWRGFLQGELVKTGRVKGVALVGVIWGVWHAPIIVMGHNYPGYPLFGPILMVAFTVAFAFVLGYAVLKTGSVWLAAFMHAIMNQTTAFMFNYVYTPNDPVFSFGAGLYTVALGAVVAALILLDPIWRRRVATVATTAAGRANAGA